MKSLITVLTIWLLLTAVAPVGAADCDTAPVELWRGMMGPESQKLRHYLKAIELCPGFIRPYELAGNIFRQNGQTDKALEYFQTAEELGSRNYKMYYLMAVLLNENGDLNEAHRQVTRSLEIRPDYVKSLKLTAAIERQLDRDGPKIVLFDPPVHRGVQVVQAIPGMTVRGRATDKDGVAWVRVNGQAVSIETEGRFIHYIPLAPGRNALRIEAADTLDNRTVVTTTIAHKASKQSGAAAESVKKGLFYRKSVAVIIGINAYDKWPSLEFAVNDALAVKQRLEAFGFERIIVLTDRQATMRGILTVFWHELPRIMDRNDRLLIFFAGHGHTDQRNGKQVGYIVPADSETVGISETAISMEQLRMLSNRIPARHLLYVMDCCYSGLGLSRSAGMSSDISGYLRKVASKRAVQIITAGGKDELAREKEGHGLFTAYFLKAIAGEADLNRDRYVTATELGAFLRPVVSEASDNSQTPLYGRIEGEGEFIFEMSGHF